MNSILELQRNVEAFLDGMISLSDLNDWLGEYADAIDQEGDREAQEVSAQVWRLISEYSAGHRTEESVRTNIKALIPIGHART
jgi:hypothetical protein